tara:strand:+ start:19 stop:2301 length:2283 start_codon:yes stop_codon:yes gene_type:complete
MISRNNYQGRLPYAEYIKRFQSAQDLNKDLKANVKKELDNQIAQGKNTISDKFKKEMEDRGIDTSKLEQIADMLKGQGSLDENKRNALYTGFLLSKAGKPSRTSLTEQETTRAQSIEASKLAYLHDDNFQTAQEHLDSISMEGAGVIDRDLSSTDSIVIKKPNGKVEIAYRGTQLTGKPSLEDLYTDANVALGTDRTTAQFERADTQLKAAIEKYGLANIDHLTGYSLGGTKALTLGQANNIESTSFNPFIGKRLARGINTTDAQHKIIRTTTDAASVGLMVSADRNHANWDIHSIRPLAENEHLIPLLETYDGHKLNNFTSNKGRGVNDTAINRLTKQNHETLTLLIRKDLQHKTANLKNEGKTFSEAVADLQKNSGGATVEARNGIDNVDIMAGPDGKPILKPGGRHSAQSDMVRSWRALDGEFTEHEATVIADTANIDKSSRTPAQETLRNRLKTSRQQEIDNIPENLMIKINGENVSSKKIAQQKLNEDYPVSNDLNPQERLQKVFKKYDDSGIGRTGGNKAEFGFPNVNYSESDNETESFINSSKDQRIKEMGDLNNKYQQDQDTLTEAFEPHEAAGLNEHLRGLSATHLGIGAAIGYLTDTTLNYIDPNDKGQGKIQGWERDALSGGVAGATTAGAATYLGLGEMALGPEVVAGAAGYIAADYGAQGGALLAKAAGGGKEVQEASADISGGLAGGLGGYLAAGLVAAGSDALVGGELGASFGPGGAAVGMAVGAGIGLAAFGYSSLKTAFKSWF